MLEESFQNSVKKEIPRYLHSSHDGLVRNSRAEGNNTETNKARFVRSSIEDKPHVLHYKVSSGAFKDWEQDEDTKFTIVVNHAEIELFF